MRILGSNSKKTTLNISGVIVLVKCQYCTERWCLEGCLRPFGQGWKIFECNI